MNEIFEEYLQGYFSESDWQKIAACYGPESADHARAIYSAVVNRPVHWSAACMNGGLKSLHELLNSEYPWLSRKAHNNLVGAFAILWK